MTIQNSTGASQEPLFDAASVRSSLLPGTVAGRGTIHATGMIKVRFHLESGKDAREKGGERRHDGLQYGMGGEEAQGSNRESIMDEWAY